MKSSSVLVGFALLLSSTFTHAASCAHPGEAAIASVVRISDGEGGFASGVVVASGLVLTAAHVIEDGGRLHVAQAGREKRAAALVAIDRTDDLALLATDTSGIAAVTFAGSHLATDDVMWAAGFPRAGDLQISRGTYRQLRGDRIESSASIDSGHSGGALFRCECGELRLAGIIHGYLATRSDSGYENTGRSVSISGNVVAAFMGDLRGTNR